MLLLLWGGAVEALWERPPLLTAAVCSSRDIAVPRHDIVIFVAPQGEYGLTNVLMSHGYNVATLMARYSPVSC